MLLGFSDSMDLCFRSLIIIDFFAGLVVWVIDLALVARLKNLFLSLLLWLMFDFCDFYEQLLILDLFSDLLTDLLDLEDILDPISDLLDSYALFSDSCE